MFRTLYTLCLLSLSSFLLAQMPATDGSIRYGNEWIDYDRAYLKVSVVEDGVYRISPQQIAAAGMSLSAENADNWVLHHEGKAVPIEVGTEGIVFYGEKNRGKMDRHLFETPDEMQLNDRYSMHTDTGRYFLSLAEAGGPFYTEAMVSGGTTDLTSILRESEVVFSDYQTKTYSRASGASIYYSHYEPAEGFGSRSSSDLLSSNGSVESTATLALPGANGSQATLDLRFGLGFGAHVQEIKADNGLLTTVNANNWTVHQPQLNFNPNGEEAIISLTGTASDQDKANLGWVKVTYPASPVYDAALSSFLLPASTPASRLQLAEVGADAGAMKLYDPAAQRFIEGTVSGGSATFQLPAKSNEGRYQLVRNNQFLAPVATVAHRFTPTVPENVRTNYLLLTSSRLNGGAIEEMANYRRSAAGGSYVVHIVDVEDLYDEFGYGIARHPMALRNYLTAARQASPDLQYLFLVGKGREYADVRLPEQLASERATYFVPSFGFPASDNLLSADLGDVVPHLSTGRLAAINEAEIAIYLDKLMGVESQINRGGQTIEDRDWMKQVIHLGGGRTAGEQFSIRRNLSTIEQTISNSEMGANVNSFFKTSTDPIEDSRQEAIFDRINNGSAIVTFYGHSSSQGFDFSIDDPENYFNKDKYPYMLSLGCYSGDAFTKARSISEKFIFLRDKGAITFAASKGVGYIGALRTWADRLYDETGNAEYGNGVGDALRKTIEYHQNTSATSLAILLEQFALSGDPAYRLHPRPGPDLVVEPSSIVFTPNVVPAQDEDYTIKFNLLNLGSAASQDSIDLEFRQQLPSGEVLVIYTHRVATPFHREEVELQLPNQGLTAVGQNRIFITVDKENELTELPQPIAELNNEAKTGGALGVPLTFIANTAKVAFPPEYAVIGGEIELISSTTSALADERVYIIQIATDQDFREMMDNSRTSSPGGVIRYKPAFTPTDSTTYYWRISPDSVYTEGAGYIWSESSFTWLANQPEDVVGWAMQHPGQIIDGDFKNIQASPYVEDWNFTKSNNDVRIINAVYADRFMPRFDYNGQRLNAGFEWRNHTGVTVLVSDSTRTGSPGWLRNPGGGAYGAHPRASLVWSFNTRTDAGRKGLLQFLQEGIEPGKYVLFYSTQRGSDLEYYSSEWLRDSVEFGTNIVQVLQEEGALEIGQLTNLGSVPYVFSYQKGMGALGEAVAQTVNDTITMSTVWQENWPEGEWQSTKVGPAKSWHSLSIGQSPENYEPGDSMRLIIYAGKDLETATVFVDTEIELLENSLATLDISSLDPVANPFLWAEVVVFDPLLRTSRTLNKLYVNFGSFGDVAISPGIELSLPDSLVQGEQGRITIGYENISKRPMDSLLVSLALQLSDNTVINKTKRQANLGPGQSDQVSFDFSTEEIDNDYSLSMVLNPDQDQPEPVIFNNYLSKKVLINKDRTDPIIELLFDGRRISNREIVSSEAEILISIRDENEFLPLNDTAALQIRLIKPDGGRELLAFSDDNVSVNFPSGIENKLEVFYKPALDQDGAYSLEIFGSDRSQNSAGDLQLKTDFQVINKRQIGNVLPYPNPFSTSTNFVYTLTGDVPPDVFRIQIMTVSGRVVRDIDLAAEESLNIGTHQTNFTWDGTDEYGDQLANGVYLYRIITSIEDGEQKFEKMEDSLETYFSQGLGKIVILR